MAMAPFDEITAIYTSFHAWSYEPLGAPAVFLSRHVIDDRFLPHLPRGARVLDVGCGGAKFTKYIADQRPDVPHRRPRPVQAADRAC
jgi:2-polyprenyl-3-methyl-5-hydroxy-6-metoxy-1,4-benzoquinol methylase